MESRASQERVWRCVLGMCLTVMLATAAPLSQTDLDQLDLQTDTSSQLSSEQILLLLHFLRTVLSYTTPHYNPHTDASRYSSLRGLQASKRGFGIAGLDNVDMITSTLDRSRSMSRSRGGPVMSSGLTLDQLRAMMAKAG